MHFELAGCDFIPLAFLVILFDEFTTSVFSVFILLLFVALATEGCVANGTCDSSSTGPVFVNVGQSFNFRWKNEVDTEVHPGIERILDADSPVQRPLIIGVKSQSTGLVATRCFLCYFKQ